MVELNKSRILHSLGVAKKMKKLAAELHPGNNVFAEDMFTLGLLHDIGYEFAKKKNEHAIIGGVILRNSEYKYWQEVYNHGKSSVGYKSKELDLLNIADLLTSASGQEITVEERLADVRKRFGENSFAYKDFLKLAKNLSLI